MAEKNKSVVRQASAPLLLTQDEVNQFELHMDLSGYVLHCSSLYIQIVDLPSEPARADFYSCRSVGISLIDDTPQELMYLSLANLHVRPTPTSTNSPRAGLSKLTPYPLFTSRAQLDVLATNLNQQLELHVGRFQVRREHLSATH